MRKLRQIDGLPWSEISLPGRSSKACMGEYYARCMAQTGPPRRRGRKPPGAPVLSATPAPVVPVAVVAPEPSPPRDRRQQDLGILRAWAELRGRIAERGLTGGVFGDPPPGRSALDARMAGHGKPRKPYLTRRGLPARC